MINLTITPAPRPNGPLRVWIGSVVLGLCLGGAAVGARAAGPSLAKIRVAGNGRGFVTSTGAAFVPVGVTYFRPGTGWAPQVWKQFDPAATRADLLRLRELGGNCVRVFLSYGSFYESPGHLSPAGVAKFDQFLALAEEVGVYVHPTGPDHWEGLPAWASGDRLADETVLRALEQFWQEFATRYAGRPVLFAYDLLNEPEVGWNTPALRTRWNAWLTRHYETAGNMAAAWGTGPTRDSVLGSMEVPPRDIGRGRELLDYQHCREEVAEEWTRRQARAIKAADPAALVTVGLIQWSVPVGIAGAWHYSAFRPERVAPWLDFMEIHFYPLARGFYEYRNDEDEGRNLAYLESVLREVVGFHKPTVIAEFGWYGGGRPTIDGGAHPFASEAQQARWGRRVVESSAALGVSGWLNWALHDHPGAGDVTEFIGLLTADGRTKAWGKEFGGVVADSLRGTALGPAKGERPTADWDLLTTDGGARESFRESYYRAYRGEHLR